MESTSGTISRDADLATGHTLAPNAAPGVGTAPPADASAKASAATSGSAPNADPLIGTVIADRYRLIERVGEGGMGAVYRGEHVTLRKRVAVKFLHAELSRISEVVARFEREAIAAANLEHPNVVAAHDFGKANGLFFLAMEFVDGGSLRTLLEREKRLAPVRALHITRHIAAALNRAHALGIVHRDLKPENVVLVEREGDRDFAKVIDFGIAKVSPEKLGSGGGPALTQAGMVFGTPDYMAPEQALGSKVDHRADLYAFGVMVFEMLAGRRPFVADEVMTLLGQHMTAPPPPASVIAPPGALPPAVDPVLARMLAKSPNDRFGSAVEFVQALEQALGVTSPSMVLGMTPPFGVALPPSMITGQLAALPGVTPAHGVPAAVPSLISGQLQSVSSVPAYGTPAGFFATGAPGAVPAPHPPTQTLTDHAVAQLTEAYRDLRSDPQRYRRVVMGVGTLGLLAVLLGLLTRPGRHHAAPHPTPHVPAVIARHAAEPEPAPPPPAREALAPTAPTHLTPEPTAAVPATAGPGLPPELAGQLAEYQARPNVAVLLRAAQGRQLRAVISAFEQTRAQAPNDPIVTYVLATLYARQRGGATRAVEYYAAALAAQPGFAHDPTLVRDVVRAATEGRRPPAQATELVRGALAETAAPALVDQALSARSMPTRGRAADLLATPELSSRLDATDRGLLELSRARTCEQKLPAVQRLGARGEARALPYLRRIPVGRGCGLFGLGECNPCLTDALPAAISAIERRAN